MATKREFHQKLLNAFGVMKARSAANRAAVVDRRLDRQEEKSRRQDRGLDTRLKNVGMPVTYERARHDDPDPSVNIHENPKLIPRDEQQVIMYRDALEAHSRSQGVFGDDERPPTKKYGKIRTRGQRYMDEAAKATKRKLAPLAEGRKTAQEQKVQTNKRTNRMLDRKLARQQEAMRRES